MAKAYMCDACDEIIKGNRTMVKIVEVKEGGEPRDTKTLESLDMHVECVQKFLNWAIANKEQSS